MACVGSLLACTAAPAFAQGLPASAAAPSTEGGRTPAQPAAKPDLRGLIAKPEQKPDAAPASKNRWALLIGNRDYEKGKLPVLKNPEHDVDDLGAALSKLGWRTTVAKNLGPEQMRKVLAEFINQLKDDDDALFIGAMHGTQVNGKNYLLPIDTEFRSQVDVQQKAINANAVVESMARNRSGVNVVILDACRDNPLPATNRTVGRGLAPMDVENVSNTLIEYATGPNQTAEDGSGRNGTFTKALLEHIIRDDEVRSVFNQTRADVKAVTGGRQIPWEASSIEGSFWFTSKTEPLRVEQQSEGHYLVRQVSPFLQVAVVSRGTLSDVRKFALDAYGAEQDWATILPVRLSALDDGFNYLAQADALAEKLRGVAGCELVVARLDDAHVRAIGYKADGNAAGMIEAARGARDYPISEGCHPPGIPWKPIVAIAAGAAALGAGIWGTVSLTQASGKWDDAQARCQNNVCGPDSDGPKLSRDAKAAADRATALYTVSAVLLAGGLAAYIFWPEASSETPPGTASSTPALNVYLSSTGTLITARMAF